MKQIFESERISFVEVSENLIGDYLIMVNDVENVRRFIGGKQEPYTAEQEISWVRGKLENKEPVFSMIEKESGDFIGNIELMDVTGSEGELGIAITAKKVIYSFVGSRRFIASRVAYGKMRSTAAARSESVMSSAKAPRCGRM